MHALSVVHALAEQGDLDEASRKCSELLNEHPHNPKVLAVSAWIYMRAKRFGLAYCLLEKAAKLWPNDITRSDILNNLGMCAFGCMLLNESEEHLTASVRVNPNNYAPMNNLSLVYVNKCEPGLAIEWANKSRKLVGDDPALMESYGYAQLMLGNWQEGWTGFEGGLEGDIRRSRQYQNEPYWDGSPVKTLVIRGEQGIGDEISFASMILDAKSRAENVVYECDARLEGLFKRSFDIPVLGSRFHKTIDWADKFPIDARVLSGSLGQYFRLKDEDFPGTPYLKADPERKLQWRALLDSLGSRKKIGIAWTGGRHNTHRERRSLRLTDLLPILKQDADFISLEYKDPRAEIAELKEQHGITVRHWARGAESQDYDDVAALVDELDCVISVQTAVVHLSGALGKPCHVLVPEKPHWRYRLKGDSMPWYQSVHLYRQKNGWERPINDIVQAVWG